MQSAKTLYLTILLATTALLYSYPGHSISESDLKDQYLNEVLPFYETGSSHQLASFDGAKLHYRHFNRGHSRTILILPGRTEPTSKYAELVYDLRHLNYDFILLDHRGQGYSERLIPIDPKKGHVRSYRDYAKDLKVLKDHVLADYDEVVAIAHSMGGGIALLTEEKYPGTFSKMILSSPLMQMKTNGLSEPLAYASLQALSLIGKGRDYIPGGGADQISGPFEENRVTSSPSRYWMARDIEEKAPELIMASATVGWSLEAIKMGRAIFRSRKKVNFPPILLFQAEFDEFSHAKRQNIFCSERTSCELIFMRDSKHEMLQERDSIRNHVLKRINQFL